MFLYILFPQLNFFTNIFINIITCIAYFIDFGRVAKGIAQSQVETSNDRSRGRHW